MNKCAQERPFLNIDKITSIPCLRQMQTKMALAIGDSKCEIDRIIISDGDKEHLEQKIIGAKALIEQITDRINFLLTNQT